MNINSAGYPVPTETVEMELDTISIIKDIQMKLLGFEYDPHQGKYVSIGEPMMNEKGIMKLTTFLSSYISRDKILTDLTKEEANEIVKEASMNLIDILFQKYREFEIDPINLGALTGIIEHSIQANIYRAVNGRTLDHISNMVSISESETKSGRDYPHLSMTGGGQDD